jgi:hypothetical protein
MKFLRTLSVCLLFGFVALSNTQARADDSQVSLQVDALYLWSDDLGSFPLIVDSGAVVYTSDNLSSFDGEAGVRGFLTVPLGGGLGLHIGGFYSGSFDSSGQLGPGLGSFSDTIYEDNPVITGNPFLGNSSLTEVFTFKYERRLWDVEANVSGPSGNDGIRMLGGFRYLRLDNKLSSVAYDELNDFNGTDNDIDRVSSEVENHLMGVQVGLQGTTPITNQLSFGGRAVAGVAINHLESESLLTADDNEYGPFAKSDSENDVSFFMELAPELTIALADNFDVSLGAFGLLVTGTSDGFDEYSRVANTAVNPLSGDDIVFFYGVKAGGKLHF